MILNNYWELRRVQQLYKIEASEQYINTTMKDINNGDTVTFCNGVSTSNGSVYSFISQSFNLTSNVAIRLGDSTEEGSVTDYTLKSPISSGVTVSNINWNISTQNSSKRILSFNVTASTDININEVGITKSFPTTYSGSTMKEVLLVRVILANTVSLQSGESATITIEWDEA